MTPPQTTPLILRSSLKSSKLTAKTDDPEINAGIVDKIIESSATLQLWAQRRFDERIDTVYHAAWPQRYGGDIEGPELFMKDDLRSVTTIINGDTVPVDSSLYVLLPRQANANGVSVKSSVRLLNTATGWWNNGVNGVIDSIAVSGLWGYGGQWKKTGITVANGLASDIDADTFAASTALELGMMLRIDSEYLYVSDISGTLNVDTAVERACNGSTAAVHADATNVYRWEAHPLVQKLVTRLTLISIEQDSSPLFSQLILADTAVPVSSDGTPKDVLFDVQKMGLKRKQRITAI